MIYSTTEASLFDFILNFRYSIVQSSPYFINMELITSLAGIVVVVMNGALARVGEIALDGTIDKFKQLLQRKSPAALRQLECSADNTTALPETIKVMATLIEEDEEIKAAAEEVAKENESKPYVINMMKNVGFIVQEGGKVEGVTQNFY